MVGLRGRRLAALVAVAAVLIALFSWQGYNLYQTSAQQHAKYDYQPASKPGFRINAATKSPTPHYKPSCENPDDREDADLCAQWAAVDQVAEANRLASLNLRLAIFSLLFAIVGTTLLVWTLYETRLANMLQLRAYVNITHIAPGEFAAGKTFRAKVVMANKGATPAYRVQVHAQVSTRPLPLDPESLVLEQLADQDRSVVVLAKEEPMNIHPDFAEPFQQNLIDAIQAGEAALFCFGVITYEDIYGTPHKTQFRAMFEPAAMQFSNCDEGNESD
jgi:hypothetical protein